MNKDMLTDSYNYELSKDQIADRPIANRHNSKLLVYEKSTDKITHSTFKELSSFLSSDTLLVLNKTKVFNSRLLCKKETGGAAEIFLLSTFKEDDDFYKVMIKTSRKKKLGDKFVFKDGSIAKIVKDFGDGTFGIELDSTNLDRFLQNNGSVPIPPYIRDGISDERDIVDYQTVYAKNIGSVAAPTAGLHFSDQVFESLSLKNIDKAFVTLHVGMGTFLPVKSEKLSEHKMHSEDFYIDEDNLMKLNNSKKRVAVGTTTLRVLESTYKDERFDADPGELNCTDIFLHPGVDVKSIDGLITNFHLPKSSLLMLVSSLIGREKTLELYEIAKENHYRFYSYGDAMLLLL